MISYRLHFSPSLPVVVKLDVQDPDTLGPLLFEGQEDATELVKEAVASAGGVNGHHLGYETTGADLGVAMGSGALAAFGPELLEGQDILSRFVRELPPPGGAD